MSLSKPTFTLTPVEGGVELNGSARTMSEARKMLRGLKRKLPGLDVEAALAGAQVNSTYSKGLVHHSLTFGGELAGRSVVKSALALAYDAGVPLTACGDALRYLQTDDAEPCFGYVYDPDVVVDRPIGLPLHCVAVHADPSSGLVLGYVEYFGVQRIAVRLGQDYAGRDVSAIYAIDPRSGSELPLDVSLSLSPTDIEAIFAYPRALPNGVVEAFKPVLDEAVRSKAQDEQERVVSQAVAFAFANCGAKEGEIITPDQGALLSGLLIEKLGPYLEHLVRRRPPHPALNQPDD